VLGVILVFVPDAIRGDLLVNSLKLGSLILISPLAFFFGLQYRQSDKQDEKVEALEERTKEAADTISEDIEEVIKDEKDSLKGEDMEKLNEILEETEDLRAESKQWIMYKILSIKYGIISSLILILLLTTLYLLLNTSPTALAQTMSNAEYIIQMGNLNSISGKPTGSGFALSFTAGQTGNGLYSGTNLKFAPAFNIFPPLSPSALASIVILLILASSAQQHLF